MKSATDLFAFPRKMMFSLCMVPEFVLIIKIDPTFFANVVIKALFVVGFQASFGLEDLQSNYDDMISFSLDAVMTTLTLSCAWQYQCVASMC